MGCPPARLRRSPSARSGRHGPGHPPGPVGARVDPGRDQRDAGAQGELTGILMIRADHRSRGDTDRLEVLIPDSSHGTNPATAWMAGFKTITIRSAPDGGVGP